MNVTLPNTNGIESAEERYDRCVRTYNRCVRRHNSAADELTAAEGEYGNAYGALAWLEGTAIPWFYDAKHRLEAADRDYDDARRWLDEARDDLNRAASVVGLPGAP